jgi:hypothetical protein
MEMVRARLGQHVDHRPAVASEFGRIGIGFHLELGDGVHGGLDGEGASLVDILIVAIVVRPVQDVVVLVLRYAVGRKSAAG